MIKLLLQYATLQLSAIDKTVFSFEFFFDILRKKNVFGIKVFFCKFEDELLQNTHLKSVLSGTDVIQTVKLQSCTEYFFNLLQEILIRPGPIGTIKILNI